MSDSAVYCAVDIETTGLDAKSEDIAEVGAVRFADGKPVAEFQSLIRPSVEIPPDASAVHGLYAKDLVDAPLSEEVMPRLAEFLGDAPLVFHYAPFDLGFLLRDCHAYGIELRAPLLDTRALAEARLPSLKSRDLDSVCRKLGVVTGQRHRSIGDAIATGQALWAMLRRGGSMPAWEFEILLSEVRWVEPLDIAAAELAHGLEGLSTRCPRGAAVSLEYTNSSGQASRPRLSVEYYQIERGTPYVIARTSSGERRSYRFDRIASWSPG